jgi:hypothetical protein
MLAAKRKVAPTAVSPDSAAAAAPAAAADGNDAKKAKASE